MSCYPEADSHIRDIIKVVLEHASGIDIYDLASRKDLLLWKLKLTN